MNLRYLLVTFFLLFGLCLAQTDLARLTQLFHSGEFEQLVAEGELLGKRYQEENNRDGVAKVYQMLTIAYMRLGRQEEMMKANTISKAAFASINETSADPADRERAITQKASSLFSAGDLDQTIAHVDENWKKLPPTSPRRFYLFKPKYLALAVTKDYEKALAGMQPEIEEMKQLAENDTANRAAHLANLGRAHLLISETTTHELPKSSLEHGLLAKRYLAEVDISALPGGPNLPYRLAAAAGEYQRALQLFDEYDGQFPSGLPFYRFEVESRRAYWLDQLGQKDKALETYLGAINLIDKAWSGLKIRQNKADLLQSSAGNLRSMPTTKLFERALSLSLESGQDLEALEISELFKSRTLRDSLKRQELEKINPPKVPVALLTRERSLQKKLSAKSSAEDLRDYLAVLDEIRVLDQEYFNLLTGNPGKLELPTLAADEVLVEYFLTDSELFIFVLDQGKVSAVRAKADRKALENGVRGIRRSIVRIGSERSLKKKLRSISDLLLSPVEAKLAGKKRVIFVPHGKLHYLPFASLLSKDNEYLVKSLEVNVAPSAHSLTFSQRKNPRRQSGFKASDASSAVFALGDIKVGDWEPLPGTKLESNSVGQRLPNSTVLLAQEMTRAKVLQGMAGKPFIHFATHGFFNKQDALKSGLVTADQAITVADILTNRLEAYSIFLSACETAVGKEVGADELVGLQQSFQYAGSPSVVATLWQISDEATIELVNTFYDGLQTKSKGQSLREAQLAMLGSQFSHPYYWAAFVLSGDWI